MIGHPTVASALVVAVQRYAEDSGIEVTLSRPQGDPEDQVPLPQFLSLWGEVRSASGDPDFGLHIGEFISRVGDQHALSQMLVHCETLGQALKVLCDYHALLVEIVQPRVTEGRLVLEPCLGDRHLTEAVFANLSGTFRRLAGANVRPREVRFSHRAPIDVREHVRIFKTRVRFDQSRDELWFVGGDLERRLPLPNPRLRAVLEAYVRQTLERQREDRPAIREVTRAVADTLPAGRPSLSTVACRLATSPRTLQNRLRDEGTSYQALLDKIRYDMARLALRETKQPLASIAQTIGFADQPAFQRFYKRCAGRTPKQERESN